LTIVKLRTCHFPPLVALCFYSLVFVLLLALTFFFPLYEGTKSAAQSKTSTTFTSSRRNELRAGQLYSVSLRTAYVCVVLIPVLRACGHLGLWCPIYVMRECLFVCCWLLGGADFGLDFCDACRHQVKAPLVRRDWVQVRTILRSTMDWPELQRAEGSL